MERSRVLGRWAVGTAALALVLSACGGGSGGSGGSGSGGGSSSGASGAASSGGGKEGGTVTISLSEPQYLTPGNTNETNGSEVLDALFTGLIKYDQNNKPQLTDLAQSIDSTDNKTWDVKLKPGWTFHDGTPVTAKSFVDAWNYAAYAPNGQLNAPFFSNIQGFNDLQPAKKGATPKAKTMSGLKVVSDTEFKATLDAPSNVFKTALGYTAFYPLPEAFFKDPKKFQEAPIGDGPFKMSGSWVHNQSIKVVRYDGYKGSQKPHVAEIDYKMYKAQETAYNDLLAGSLDILVGVPPADLGRAKQDLGDRYKEFPSSNYGFLGFPVFDPTYRDEHVRRAISMAIDRATIAKTIFQGTRVPADDFIAPVIPGYRKGACGKLCTFDPAAAKAEWSQATNKPSTVTLTYNADGGHKEWIEAACNNIKKTLDVQCIGKPAPDFATMLNNLDKAKKSHQSFGPFRLGWIMDYPIAQDYLEPLYGTNGSSNYYGYSNPKFDALVKKGTQETSPDAAVKDWQQADDILAQDAPVAPIYFGTESLGWSNKVSNVTIDAFQKIDKFALTAK